MSGCSGDHPSHWPRRTPHPVSTLTLTDRRHRLLADAGALHVVGVAPRILGPGGGVDAGRGGGPRVPVESTEGTGSRQDEDRRPRCKNSRVGTVSAGGVAPVAIKVNGSWKKLQTSRNCSSTSTKVIHFSPCFIMFHDMSANLRCPWVLC